MAGSYRHCVNEKGEFRQHDFTEMIENLGDAHEACEEMYLIIQELSGGDKKLIETTIEKIYKKIREQ